MAKVGPLSGQTLGGKYKLGDLLGEGGFGAVYRAENLLLKRQQAIKVLLPEHLNDPWVRNRFISEAEAQAKLDHPNIISIQDFGVEGGKHPYLVMPYINGGTLEAVISKRQKPLALDEIVNYLEPICRALDYIHQKNLVHLDLKPSNLLIHEDSRLLLSDFGLVRPVTQGKAQGGPSLGAGTPFYMAPEHKQGRPDKRSDVYSVGMILYQMILHQVAPRGTVPLQTARPDLPAAAVPVLKQGLAPLPEDRYQTAGALLSAFKAAVLFRPTQQIPHQPRPGSQPPAPTIPAHTPPLYPDWMIPDPPPSARPVPSPPKKPPPAARNDAGDALWKEIVRWAGLIPWIILDIVVLWVVLTTPFAVLNGSMVYGFLTPSIGVFLFRGWVMALITGEAAAGFDLIFWVGVPASALFYAILGAESFANIGVIPLGQVLADIAFTLLFLLLAALIGSIATILGGLVGKIIYSLGRLIAPRA